MRGAGVDHAAAGLVYGVGILLVTLRVLGTLLRALLVLLRRGLLRALLLLGGADCFCGAGRTGVILPGSTALRFCGSAGAAGCGVWDPSSAGRSACWGF